MKLSMMKQKMKPVHSQILICKNKKKQKNCNVRKKKFSSSKISIFNKKNNYKMSYFQKSKPWKWKKIKRKNFFN